MHKGNIAACVYHVYLTNKSSLLFIVLFQLASNPGVEPVVAKLVCLLSLLVGKILIPASAIECAGNAIVIYLHFNCFLKITTLKSGLKRQGRCLLAVRTRHEILYMPPAATNTGTSEAGHFCGLINTQKTQKQRSY